MPNETEIAHTKNELSEAIEDAAYGVRSWDEVTKIYTEVFPNSFAAIVALDLKKNLAAVMKYSGLDGSFTDSYQEYYSSINPWNPQWLTMRPGDCFVCNHTLPTTAIKNTEFYQDWLRRTGDFDSAVGLKAEASNSELIHLAIHYPFRLSEQYDRQIFAVTHDLGLVISRALRTARFHMQTSRDLSAASALAACGLDPGVVVNADSRLIDANAAAQELLRAGRFLTCYQGLLGLKDSQASAMMRRDTNRLATSPASRVERTCIVTSNGTWALSYMRLPSLGGAAPILFDRLVLIRFRKMTPIAQSANLNGLAAAYKLTGAEQKLCEKLSLGLTVSAAAEELSWTYETGRSTLKQIFLKINVGRQAELVRLLDRWLTP